VGTAYDTSLASQRSNDIVLRNGYVLYGARALIASL
jgi:hypothetical protein